MSSPRGRDYPTKRENGRLFPIRSAHTTTLATRLEGMNGDRPIHLQFCVRIYSHLKLKEGKGFAGLSVIFSQGFTDVAATEDRTEPLGDVVRTRCARGPEGAGDGAIFF